MVKWVVRRGMVNVRVREGAMMSMECDAKTVASWVAFMWECTEV